MYLCVFFFFKQKSAYELRISDWISDVCSSDLVLRGPPVGERTVLVVLAALIVEMMAQLVPAHRADAAVIDRRIGPGLEEGRVPDRGREDDLVHPLVGGIGQRSWRDRDVELGLDWVVRV